VFVNFIKSVCLSIAVGAFIYISLVEIMNEHDHFEKKKKKKKIEHPKNKEEKLKIKFKIQFFKIFLFLVGFITILITSVFF
jgi:anaerobic C4-dicarboxylate transporter